MTMFTRKYRFMPLSSFVRNDGKQGRLSVEDKPPACQKIYWLQVKMFEQVAGVLSVTEVNKFEAVGEGVRMWVVGRQGCPEMTTVEPAPPVNRDTTENITLLQTTYAAGNEQRSWLSEDMVGIEIFLWQSNSNFHFFKRGSLCPAIT